MLGLTILVSLRHAFVGPSTGETVWYLSNGMSKPLFAGLLAAFARAVGAGPTKRVVLLLDNAGFHTRPNLTAPDGIRLVYPPPYSPELQPAETLYLLKPVSIARLEQAFARVAVSRSLMPTPRAGLLNEIWAPRGREMTRVAVETLDFFQSERDYVRLHAAERSFLIRMTLRELEGRLDPERFLRIHRSTLVAAYRIVAFEVSAGGGWTVSLSSGHRLRVGRSFRSPLRNVTAGAASDRCAPPQSTNDVS